MFVIYSEPKSASSCPSGIPTTLPAADLHQRGAEEEEREMEGSGREGESAAAAAAADSGKVNIISNLLILLEWLGCSAFWAAICSSELHPSAVALLAVICSIFTAVCHLRSANR